MLVFTLATSMLSVSPLPRRLTPNADAAAAKPICPVSRPDRVSAMTAARLCGGRVRVDGDESETTEAFALPDGSLQASTAMAPQRVRQADGSWRPVDLSLRFNKDGTVSPVASAFSVTAVGATTGAGEHHLVSVGSAAGAVSLDWTGPLPAPKINGSTATYSDVRPGVDLVVQMTASGVEQNVVLKNRAAVGEIKNLMLPVVAAGEHSFKAAHGAVVLQDGKGHAFARIPGMQMWDSAPADPATGEPVKHDLAATVAALPTKAGRAPGVGLTLTPDAKWLADPTRVFPIVLDPTINPESTTFDTYVRDDLTSDRSGDQDLQLGVTSGHVARTFLSWDTTAMEHAVVSSATVYFYDWYSQSCTPASWEVWSTSSASTTPYTQWSNQPAKIKKESTSTATKGNSTSCADGWISVDGKNFFQDAANTGKSRGYMELVATDEGPTSIGFKQLRSRNYTDPSKVPYAVVTYTSTPIIGTRTTVPSTTCVTGSARPFINTKTPTLKAVVTQGDGSASTANFEWWNVGGARIGTAAVTGVASGATASKTVPSGAFAEGSSYEWRVDANSGVATSAWSSYCEFTVDTIAPAVAPTVSSTTYPAGQWSGSAGTAGTFTLGANGVSDVNSYLYGLDTNPPTTSVAASGLGGAASVSITPATNGSHVLYVQSVDRAGNKSTITQYAFNVGNAAVTSPSEGVQAAGTAILSGLAPSTTSGVTYQWRRATTDTWVTIPKTDVTYTQGGGAVASWPVAPSGGAYPSLNWNVKQTLANANTPANLAGRWMLADGSGSTASDMTGAHPATLNGAIFWSQDPNHGTTASFDGSTTYGVTTTPVMVTTSSYTVSSWVKLSALTGSDQTVVSQNGTTRSPFYLQLSGSTSKWQLNIDSADVSSPTWYTARSTSTAQTGVWTHLVGVYDSAAATGKLYVNGVLEATVTGVTTWNSTGGTWIGRSAATWWHGNLSDVQIYTRALSATEISNLYGTGTVTGDAVALAGPVQVQAIFAGTGGGTTTPVHFTFDPNSAFAPSPPVGPGTVNMVTGDYTIGASDGSDGSDLGISRIFSTRQAGVSDPMFGPGWVSGVRAPTSDYTGLTAAGTLVQLGMPDGATLGFSQASTNASGATYVPQVGSGNYKLTYTTSSDTYSLTDPSGDVTLFTHTTGAVAGSYNPTSSTPVGSSETTTMAWQKTASGVQPTQLVAPVPSGVSCPSGAAVKGCRVMKFNYATSTTATGTTQAGWGDYVGRLKSVTVTAWDPATVAMKTVTVSQYQYGSDGRLTAQWDPRLDNGATHLWTTYSYDANGILATMTPPAQQPWMFSYTTVPGDSGFGRLAAVSRSALPPGTATTTVVYHVPVSGSGAPYDLSSAQTSRWGQSVQPVAATAVFGPDFVPNGNQASGVMPSSYVGADITYMDANNRRVNTADGNGNIDATWHDAFGNTVQQLTAGNRAAALNASGSDTPVQEAAIASRESTLDVYSADGMELLDSYGPEHDTQLASGAIVRGRDHEQMRYDEGATGGPYELPTTDIKSVRWYDGLGAARDDDSNTTTNTYDWTTRELLASAVDPSGLNLVTTYTYDPTTGQQASETKPAGAGTTNTPQTTNTLFYRAGTGSGYVDCNNHPEWDGLVCRTQVGGQAASGPEVLVKLYTYDMFDQQASVVEKTDITGSYGTVERTTMTTYDGAERPLTTSITTAAGLGTAVPTTKVIYDPATGQATSTQSLDANNNVIAHIDRVFDTLGRITSYTDADGNTTTTNYDLDSRVASTTDGQGTRTYTYNGGSEHRGLATQVVDSEGGTFTATYNADGDQVAQSWPNNLVVAKEFNEAGDATSVTYTQSGATLYAQSVAVSGTGQTLASTSTLSSQQYTYDKDGRLTKVNDTVTACTTRTYSYNTGTDRIAETSYDADIDGNCQTSTAASTSNWTYDTADRSTSSGYTYDALGRAMTTPGTDTQTPENGDLTQAYFTNDMLQSLVQGTSSDTYSLDPSGNRIRSWSEITDQSSVIKINHYADDGDSPAWTDEGGTQISRPIIGAGGIAGIFDSTTGITWQISNLHGDLVAGVSETGVGLLYCSESTEFGQPRNTNDVGTRRYGWLGMDQRSASTMTGAVLMGVRLYNPTTGRFTQTDPEPGGNSYAYCNGDSIGCADLNGRDLICGTWCQTDSWLFYNSLPSFISKRNSTCKCRISGGLDWSSDGCSGVPDTPFGIPFWKACERHDFGYRNYKHQGRFTSANKYRIDRNFLHDMDWTCNQHPVRYNWQTFYGAPSCYTIASTYYQGVRALG